ncbi:probable metabolite transport protein [[Candida] railenensis]|uniref:Probable metabolite transport protein n=1 Tax=[Candida] railenensis TaxID=45579 RepID=A0A9P0VY27_9ASCO|nr:probable metabolite transport protein [[Candida] railenensis]
MTLTTPHNVTGSLAWATFIACLSTLQFGFHLAELNAPEAILSCQFHKRGPYESYEETIWSSFGRDQCLKMSSGGIATITTMFTVGGFVSSIILGSSKISTAFGRKKVSIINSLLFCLGSFSMAMSNKLWMFNLGRFVTGLAGGSSLVVSPILINELTPINHRGFLGSILQLAVAIGILMAQIVGYFWSNDQEWRSIFLFASGIGLFQFVILFTTVESPKWLIINKGEVKKAKSILRNLRTDHDAANHEINHWRRLSIHADVSECKAGETSALLDGPVSESSSSSTSGFIPLTRTVSRRGSIDPSHITIGDFLSIKKYAPERWAIFGLMSGQQLCGINAITFYGVRVLRDIVPEGTNVLAITCSLSICNALSALCISPFVDTLGRKKLLMYSVSIMGLSAVGISIGLTHNIDYLAAGGCFVFNIGYSIGLAPIPFLMISELASHEALSAAQSCGTALNWASNITIAFFFPILSDSIGGYIFYVFFFICAFYVTFYAKFLPETLGYSSSEEVWRDFRKE